MAVPFLKWAGSKRQLVEHILSRIPKTFNTYYEPMVGGGAVFFALEEAGKIKKARISDLNPDLIDTYVAVRDHIDELIRILREDYSGDVNNSTFFYQVRDLEPGQLNLWPQAARAARMIYLNRTCYNGLYRVNRQGKFNAPFGRYTDPKILNEGVLRDASRALQNVEIRLIGYHHVLERAEAQDFVYFDPPYIPLSSTSNFTAFTKEGFDDVDHAVLADVAKTLAKRDIYVLLSNSDAPSSHRLYAGFHIEKVHARRAINEDPNGRGAITEVLIRSYT